MNCLLPIITAVLSLRMHRFDGVDAAAPAEYCRHYPGDISFSYSTTRDQDYWYQNYKNAYVGKKGGDGNTIYRKKTTTITRGRVRPHGYSINENMNNAPFVQQVEQQQQVQQQVIGGPVPSSVNESETAPTEEEALPIWKIVIPRQTSKLVVVRVEDAEASAEHAFEMNKTHFDNPNITDSKPATSPSRTSASSSVSSSTRVVDVTDQSIVPDAWYAICLDVNVAVHGGKPSVCNHCTLLQARTDSLRQQFLDVDWVPGTITADAGELRYAAVDFPFPWATVRSQVWTQYAHPRCHRDGKTDHAIFESKEFAYPDHFTYATVRNMQPNQSYVVRVDLEFPWKHGAVGLLPQPLLVQNYLHNDVGSTLLAKCEDFEKSD